MRIFSIFYDVDTNTNEKKTKMGHLQEFDTLIDTLNTKEGDERMLFASVILFFFFFMQWYYFVD